MRTIKLLTLCSLVLLCIAAHAQMTTVSATITDSTSQVWFGGTYQIIWTPSPGYQGPYYKTGCGQDGSQFTPQQYTGTFDGSGHFSISIPDNNCITPSGTQWTFVLCAQTVAKCSQLKRTVTGATEDFTSDFSANVTPPVFATGLISYGYSTAEVQPIPLPGGFFFNVTTGCQDVWNGMNWYEACSSSSAFAIYQHNEVEVGQQPALDFDDSSTVTFTLTNDSANNRVKVSAAASQSMIYLAGTDSGTNGTNYVLTSGNLNTNSNRCPASLTTGVTALVIPVHTNTSTTPTFQLCGLGSPATIVKNSATGETALANGDIFDTGTASVIRLAWNSITSHWDLENPSASGTSAISCENWYSLYGCNANFPATTSDVTPSPYVQDVDTVAQGPPPNTFGLPWVTNVNTTCHDSSGTLSTYACAMPNATHKGDTVGFIIITDSGGGISPPTDTQLNTYTSLYNVGGRAFYYAKNVKDGNNTVTMHLGSNGGFVVMPFEIIGADPTSPILVDGGEDGSCTGQNPNFNSVTIGQSATIIGMVIGDGIAHAGYSVYSTGPGYFLPGQYTIDGGGGIGQSRSIAIEWQAFTSLGAHTPSMTASGICSTETYTIAVKLSSTGTPAAIVVAPTRFSQGYLAQPTSPDLGAADAYVVNAGGALSAGTCPPTLVPGQSYAWFMPAHANTTTTPTLNWCSLGAQTITKNGQTALVANDLITTKIAHVWWDGTYWELSDPATVSNTVASGTSTMGTSLIASGACASTVTTSAPGVATTDVIIATANVNPQTLTGYAVSATGSLYINAYPTANNVNFQVCNNTGSSITPQALTLNWKVPR